MGGNSEPKKKRKKDVASFAEEFFAQDSGLLTAMQQETDRGCALVAGEILNDVLELILRTKFTLEKVDDDRQGELLAGFNAPLANFATKISLCRAFGLISEESYQLLTALRKVRNHCAHAKAVASLDDKEIEPWVQQLREYERTQFNYEDQAPAKLALCGAIVGLKWQCVSEFHKANQIEQQPLQLDKLPTVIQSQDNPTAQ